MKTVTIRSTRVTATAMITGTDITTTMTIARILTIITTITKASGAAIRSPNKKTAAQAAVFLFPSHLLTQRLRAPNLALAALGLQITAGAKRLIPGSFAVDHHLLALTDNALLTKPRIKDGFVPAAADGLHLLQ